MQILTSFVTSLVLDPD